MTREELKQLKKRIGRQPFEAWLKLDGDFCACPFHDGDGQKSMHLVERDGIWHAHCFSECNKSWDAIAFMMQKDGITFPEACARLAGLPAAIRPPKARRKPVPMTLEQWQIWGREVEQADRDAFAASRPHSHTAGLDCFRSLGVRVKDDYLGFPYVRNGIFSGIKMRKITEKDFFFANTVDTTSLFNLDTINPFDDVYMVEGEPDVLTMAEYGFTAVSPFSSGQQKINSDALKVLLEAPRVFIVGDQDAPGKEFSTRIQKLLPADRTFRVVFSEAKDVGELALKHGDGFPSRLEALRDEAATPWVLRGNIPYVHELPREPQKWVIDRLLPYAGLTLLSGRQGSQKSLFAMLAAASMSGRRDFLGRAVLSERRRFGAPVLYLDRENPASEVNKRRERLGIIGNREFLYWGDWSKEPVPEPDDPRLFEFAASGGYFVFDSLQQWYGGENENDNTAMVNLMNKFKRLARTGAGVLILHHDNKQDRKTGKSQTRGGTAIVACTDMAIRMVKTDDEVVQLRADRFRMCAPWELDFKVDFDFRHEALGDDVYYAFHVIRDDDIASAAQRRKEEAEAAKARKHKEKFEEEAPLRARLTEAVRRSPAASTATLERQTGIRRTRITKLMADAGWVLKDGSWVEFGPTVGMPEDSLIPV
jgi:hypothetical protein